MLSGAEFLTLVTGAAQITDVSGSADSNTDKTVDLHSHIVRYCLHSLAYMLYRNWEYVSALETKL